MSETGVFGTHQFQKQEFQQVLITENWHMLIFNLYDVQLEDVVVVTQRSAGQSNAGEQRQGPAYFQFTDEMTFRK